MSTFPQKVGKRLGDRIPSIFLQRALKYLLYSIHSIKQNEMSIEGMSGKSPAIVNIMRMVCLTSMPLGSPGERPGMRMCEQGPPQGTSQWGPPVE